MSELDHGPQPLDGLMEKWGLCNHELDRGWEQNRLAGFLNVGAGTVLEWEKGRECSRDGNWLRIIEFLGYDPGPEADGLGGTLRQWRRRSGLTQGRAGDAIGVGRSAWRTWELELRDPSPGAMGGIDALLGASA